ncbi:MAG: AMP-binding protein, partial [bacterium]
MSVDLKKEMSLEKAINEISASLSSNRTRLNQEKIDSICATLFASEAKLKDIIESEKVETFFKLGTFLLNLFEKSSGQLKQPVHDLLLQFLDFGRTSLLLQKIYQEKKGDDWFELLLSIIKTVNFTTGKLFEQRLQRYGNKPLFEIVREESILEYSWNDIKEKVTTIARSLFSLALPNSVPEPVAILSENSLEMACIDLACLITGIVNVLIPANTIPAQVEFILRHSEARIIFVSNQEQLNKVLRFRSQLNNLQHIILIESSNKLQESSIISFDELLLQAPKVPSERIQQAAEKVKLGDLASIMYTSGTTEAPKGIMFSHLNIVSKRFARAIALPEIGEHDSFICYLPLFHTFGRWFEMMGCIFWGSTYVFLENPNIETVINTMQLTRPTVFISIPKKWIQLYETIQEHVDVEVAPQSEIHDQVLKLTGGCLKWGL